MSSRTMKKSLATLALALVGGLLTAAPAEAHHARPGDHVMGHRCRMYERAVSNENTPVALADVATNVPGAICEIDSVTIADGTVIVWHDEDWRRVANHDTLPAGVGPRDLVVNATWAQVRQIRTKGGQPVARLSDMIAAAAQHDITLAVDVRNRIPNPATFVNQANNLGADVRYYQLIPDNCNTRLVDPMGNLGARIGVKILRRCTTITPAQLEARGISFTQQVGFFLTDAYLAEMDRRGIEVGVLAGGSTEGEARTLISRGVDRVLLDVPHVALGWDI